MKTVDCIGPAGMAAVLRELDPFQWAGIPCWQQVCCACDARAVGFRDRRAEGGNVELACERHAEPGA